MMVLLDTYWKSPPCFRASSSKVKRVVKSRREGRKQADLVVEMVMLLEEVKVRMNLDEPDLEPIFEAVFGIGGGRE